MSKVDENNFVEQAEPIECFGVAEQLRFKEEFTLLSGSYDLKSWIAKTMKNNLAIYQEIVAPKVQEITERKRLSVNDVQKDEEVLQILKQRDKELRNINAAFFDAVIGVKKLNQTTDDLALEILQHLESSDTRSSLAAKMKLTPETLARKMNRKKLRLGELKKMEKPNKSFELSDYEW